MKVATTLTRRGIAAALRRSVRVPRDEADQLVADILKHICQALSRGQNVKITGFGTFRLHRKPARPGRNPKTGEEVIIPPRRALTFSACDEVRRLVQEAARGPRAT